MTAMASVTAERKSSTVTKQLPTQKSQSGPMGASKSYKSYQPTLPCGNKLLQRKWDQTYYNDHRRLVKSAKPMVDTKAPPIRPHITSKVKKQQIQKERSDEIDRDNLNLLKKMQHIMHTEGQVDDKYTYKHHSLNEQKRQNELDRIAKENKEMLKRLEKVEPTYKVADWIDDYRRKEELIDMITTFPDETKPAEDRNVHTNFKTMSDKKGEEKQDVLCKQNKDDQKLEAGKIHENGVNDD